MKKIRINKTQSCILDKFLRENIEILNGKTPEKIARLCGKELEFGISPSTIKNTRKAMLAAGMEVWEEPSKEERKRNTQKSKVAALEKRMEMQFVEQDKKFKIVFEKLHTLSLSHIPTLYVGEKNKDTQVDPQSYACEERELLIEQVEDTKWTSQ
jgi:hypothetical protein